MLQQVKLRKLISLIDGVKDKCVVLHDGGSKDLFYFTEDKGHERYSYYTRVETKVLYPKWSGSQMLFCWNIIDDASATEYLNIFLLLYTLQLQAMISIHSLLCVTVNSTH